MTILSLVVGLASLACFLIVLIKMFQTEGALQGILGIITCGIYALIWGWLRASRYNLRNIMIIWTVCIIVSLILNFAFGGMAVLQNMQQ